MELEQLLLKKILVDFQNFFLLWKLGEREEYLVLEMNRKLKDLVVIEDLVDHDGLVVLTKLVEQVKLLLLKNNVRTKEAAEIGRAQKPEESWGTDRSLEVGD